MLPVQDKEGVFHPLKRGAFSWSHVTLAAWLSTTHSEVKPKTNCPSGWWRTRALLIFRTDSRCSRNYWPSGFSSSHWMLRNIQRLLCSLTLRSHSGGREPSVPLNKCYIPSLRLNAPTTGYLYIWAGSRVQNHPGLRLPLVCLIEIGGNMKLSDH